MLLALDLATQTGWCAGDGSELPELGTVLMPSSGEDVGVFLSFWERWLLLKIEALQPTVVVFEAPILPRETSLHTVRKLCGLAGVTEKVCHDRKIECAEVANSTVKKELSGSGKGGKMDMDRVAKACGLSPKTYDEADAFGVWIVAVRYYAKPFIGRWDKLIWGQRGGLL